LRRENDKANLYTERGSEIVILLAGGDKSTQERDIKKAKKLAQNIEEDR
jgi:putative addiction module killer protein